MFDYLTAGWVDWLAAFYGAHKALFALGIGVFIGCNIGVVIMGLLFCFAEESRERDREYIRCEWERELLQVQEKEEKRHGYPDSGVNHHCGGDSFPADLSKLAGS